MQYTQVTLSISPLDPFRDLLIDALGNEGPYDSFEETPHGLNAYVPTTQYDEGWLQSQLQQWMPAAHITYSTQQLADKDWNEAWEKQHQPILVTSDAGCRIWVRAPFHPHRSDVDYEIEIEPKMSFGTAHHATTYMMLSYLAELPLEGLRVLDMGCGTAVLALLAKLRGASYVEGIDIDEWAYRNAIENAQRNLADIHIRIGDASLLDTSSAPFNLIIANINRNILLNDIEAYRAVLAPGGTLLLSGFYESDTPILLQAATPLGFRLADSKTRQSWTALRLTL